MKTLNLSRSASPVYCLGCGILSPEWIVAFLSRLNLGNSMGFETHTGFVPLPGGVGVQVTNGQPSYPYVSLDTHLVNIEFNIRNISAMSTYIKIYSLMPSDIPPTACTHPET